VDLTRPEIDAMLRRADELRRKLRRATRELAALGEALLRSRDDAGAAGDGDRSLGPRMNKSIDDRRRGADGKARPRARTLCT
jgi:hypothetical protein